MSQVFCARTWITTTQKFVDDDPPALSFFFRLCHFIVVVVAPASVASLQIVPPIYFLLSISRRSDIFVTRSPINDFHVTYASSTFVKNSTQFKHTAISYACALREILFYFPLLYSSPSSTLDGFRLFYFKRKIRARESTKLVSSLYRVSRLKAHF